MRKHGGFTRSVECGGLAVAGTHRAARPNDRRIADSQAGKLGAEAANGQWSSGNTRTRSKCPDLSGHGSGRCRTEEPAVAAGHMRLR